MRRRRFLQAPLAALAGPALAQGDYPPVRAGRKLVFPSDHGAHPGYRNEWWYVTGWLEGDAARGFQVTFFRNRPRIAEESASRFAPRQLLFAHAALADPSAGRLVHEQRSARAGFDLAEAAEGDTDVKIGRWSLRRRDEAYAAFIPAEGFELAFELRPTLPPVLQGDNGLSRKGPLAAQASYYYSRPQLEVSGTLKSKGRSGTVRGRAWLDHEWSSEPLAPGASGWDWVGLNGADGSALMAFRIRGRDGSAFWAGGSHRSASGGLTVLQPQDVRFEPQRQWKSPRSGIAYPVSMRVTAGPLELRLVPLMDDQELDARASTANIYWEGAVRAVTAQGEYGRGYLELTGYGRPLQL